MSGPTAVEAGPAAVARGPSDPERVAGRRSRIPGTGSGSRRGNWREARLAYLLLAPSAALLATFGLFPLGYAFVLSLRERGSVPGPFVGFANYAAVLGRDAEFWRSLTVTLFYVAGTVPATMVLGYLLAELLNRRIAGRGFFRALFFVPYIASPVAAAAIWRWIYDSDHGLANALLARFGAPHLGWLDEPTGIGEMLGRSLGWHVPAWAGGPSLALVSIMAVGVWQLLGFAVVVLLAGLSTVPGEVTEAASLDGARGWPLFRHIKLPLLSPTFFFLLVIFTIRAFQTFTQVYVLSNNNRGGPVGTTETVTLYIYLSLREYASRGPAYGSAIAMLLFAIILGLTVLQFRVLGRRVHYQ
jgi:multiple sugar transport system permease protein